MSKTIPPHKQPERRSLKQRIEVRADADGKRRIEGYAAVFGKQSDDLGWFTETIDPRAFDAVLKSKPDVRALFNHDSNWILGRTAAGTLELATDATGLRYSVTPPDTEQAKSVLAAIERGDVTGSSFSFIADKDEWTFYHNSDQPDERVVLNVSDLFDVGPVTFPAYPDTTAAMRSKEQATKQQNNPAAWWLLSVIADEEAMCL